MNELIVHTWIFIVNFLVFQFLFLLSRDSCSRRVFGPKPAEVDARFQIHRPPYSNPALHRHPLPRCASVSGAAWWRSQSSCSSCSSSRLTSSVSSSAPRTSPRSRARRCWSSSSPPDGRAGHRWLSDGGGSTAVELLAALPTNCPPRTLEHLTGVAAAFSLAVFGHTFSTPLTKTILTIPRWH